MYVTYGAIMHAYLYNLTINKITLRPRDSTWRSMGRYFFCRFQNRSLIIIKYVFSWVNDARARVSAVAHGSRSIGNVLAGKPCATRNAYISLIDSHR